MMHGTDMATRSLENESSYGASGSATDGDMAKDAKDSKGGGATKRDHISSYGIICVRPTIPGSGSSDVCEYLMVQRKDSICYVDFVRGKYNLFDLQYIVRLLSGMTAQERSWLLHRPFSTIWQKLWMSNKRFNQEFHICKDKFETLRTGFTVSLLNGMSETLSLGSLIASADPPIRESEWEFPKGRRASNETPIACALREFEEESGVDCRSVCVVPDCCTTLSKLGCNDIMYKSVLYVALSKDTAPGQHLRVSDMQAREVKRVCWFGRDEVLKRLQTQQHREQFHAIHKRISHAIANSVPMFAAKTASAPSACITAAPIAWKKLLPR